MSTVGYGDMFPVTHYGRLYSVLAMLCGQFVTSLILLAMSLASGLEMEEQKAFKKLSTIEFHTAQMHLASHIIGTATLIKLVDKGFKMKRFAKIGPFKARTKLSIQLEILRRQFKENREYLFFTLVVL